MSLWEDIRRRYLARAGKPAFGAGLRAALATAVPAYLGVALGRPQLAWVGLGAWIAGITDAGGAYRTRAVTMAATTVAIAAAGFAGSLAGNCVPVAVAVMFVAGVGLNLLRVLPGATATVGPTLVTLAVSLGAPAGAAGALERAAMITAGGVLMTAQALASSRLQPYRPVRLATAAAWACLGDVIDELRRLVADGAAVADWNEWIRRTPRRLRESVEAARAALVATRIGRPAESPTGEQLHVIIECADQALAAVVALGSLLEAPGEPAAACDPALAYAAARCGRLAQAIRTGHTAPAEDMPGLGSLPPAAAPQLRALEDLLDAAADATDAARLQGTAPPPRTPHPPRPDRLALLGAHLSGGSSVFRHGLRVGVAGAVAVLCGATAGMSHASWLTVTAVVVLQPSVGATRTRAVQRVAGTALGAAIAAALGTAAGNSVVTVTLFGISAFIARSLLPMNYGLFALFVTPAFLLFAQLTQGGVSLGGLRVVATLAGGALALILTTLWPERARAGLGADLTAALEACRRLFRAVFTGASDAELVETRRLTGLAVINADDAFQRLLVDGDAGERERDAVYRITTTCRRFNASVVAALPARATRDAPAIVEAVDGVFAAMIGALADPGARALPAGPLTALEAVAVERPIERPVEPIVRQVAALHSAVAQLVAARDVVP